MQVSDASMADLWSLLFHVKRGGEVQTSSRGSLSDKEEQTRGVTDFLNKSVEFIGSIYQLDLGRCVSKGDPPQMGKACPLSNEKESKSKKSELCLVPLSLVYML